MGKQGVIVEHESDGPHYDRRFASKVKWDYDGSVKRYKNGIDGVADLSPAPVTADSTLAAGDSDRQIVATFHVRFPLLFFPCDF